MGFGQGVLARCLSCAVCKMELTMPPHPGAAMRSDQQMKVTGRGAGHRFYQQAARVSTAPAEFRRAEISGGRPFN